MVGLKTFWILISSLFLFAACLPQTKQTECGSNEAFNASLRTCVPIVGGPSSFINIASYTPAFTQTRYKDDTTVLTFTITVSNPYAQSYTIAWERVFNAGPVAMCSNSPSCSFPASLLGNTLGEIGTHILTAKIKDGNGAVVDTHSFELKINDLPKPIINTATMDPAFYALDKIPTDPRVPFSFTIRNNNAAISLADNYRTTWTVVKNGTIIQTEVDPFTNFTLSGTNIAYFGTYAPPASVPAFNPATLGVGSYIVRAVVQNDSPGEIVAEQQWNVLIKQPDLANVTTISLPAPGVTITAHNGVDYNDFPSLSWVSGSPASQPNFCVDIDDRDGTYAGDGKSIQVRFYLDSLGGDICTKTTLDTPGTQTVCLIDANNCAGSGAPFDTSLLRFTNSSSSIAQGHKVTARLFDEATTQEFQRSDVLPSNGSYPIEWNVMVNPINTAPQMAFGPSVANPTGCTPSGAFSRSGCAVTQGTPFTISFTVTDDFYNPATNPGEFLWDLKLKRNGSDISTPPFITGCTKALGAVTPAYTTMWSCTMVVPHYISTGALHPTGPFQVVATMQDSGSPIGGAPLASQSLTWNLSVTETNSISPNIQITPQTALASSSHIARETPLPITYFNGSNFATELETIVFRIAVRDPELDDFAYTIYKCATGSTSTNCVSPVALISPATNFLRNAQPPVVLPFTDTTNTDPVLVNALSYTLTETQLLDAGYDVSKTTDVPFYFMVEVSDRPSTLPTLSRAIDTEIFSLNVRNYNPAPVINTAGANPDPNTPASAYPVVAGFPFSINPGTVTDASTAASEATIIYQWYASHNLGTNWFAIPGATSKNLNWTPDKDISSTITLKLCVGDRPAANPIVAPGTVGANCSVDSWYIAPKTYLALPTSVSPVTSDVAVWHDTTDGDPDVDVIYTAYIGNDKKIYVNKVVREKTTLALNTTSFSTINFDALVSGTPTQVVGLSLSGTANSLYVAYGASHSSTPLNLVPRLRRIDKSFSGTVGEKTAASFNHKGKFGFNYTKFPVVPTCTSGSNCVVVDGTTSGATTIEFDGGLADNDTIRINGSLFTAADPGTAANQICSAGACSGANEIAANLAAKVNASTDPLLQGITATAAGGVVTLHGMSEFDELDWDGSHTNIPSLVIGNGGMGKIFVVGNFWFMPIINASLLGTDNNNISIFSGPIDRVLQNNSASDFENNILTEIGEVKMFDSELTQASDLVIASISNDISDSGRVKLSRYTLNGTTRDYQPVPAPAVSQINPFGTKLFQSIELAANTTGNNYIYVMGKERVTGTGKYNFGRYPADLSGAGTENIITDNLEGTSTSTVITDALLENPSLVPVPNSSDARLFFNSGATTRAARWKVTNKFDCGSCEAIGRTGTTSKIAVSNVVEMTLGMTGYLPNQNVKDVAFIFMNYDDSSVLRPQLGLINLEVESIHSTSTDTTNHLWRVPFAK